MMLRIHFKDNNLCLHSPANLQCSGTLLDVLDGFNMKINGTSS